MTLLNTAVNLTHSKTTQGPIQPRCSWHIVPPATILVLSILGILIPIFLQAPYWAFPGTVSFALSFVCLYIAYQYSKLQAFQESLQGLEKVKRTLQKENKEHRKALRSILGEFGDLYTSYYETGEQNKKSASEIADGVGKLHNLANFLRQLFGGQTFQEKIKEIQELTKEQQQLTKTLQGLAGKQTHLTKKLESTQLALDTVKEELKGEVRKFSVENEKLQSSVSKLVVND